MIDTTIVIPAYKPVSLLKECIQSILKNTDLTKVEILVVCNGSDRESGEYLLEVSRDYPVRFIWYQEALGFTLAANIGLKFATTPYIILLNSDVVILDFCERHYWVNKLIGPLRNNAKVAVTGLCKMWFNHRPFFPFFCVGLTKEALEKVNYLDLSFSPGYGEDTDYCLRVCACGYDIVEVATDHETDHERKIHVSSFPINHYGRGSFKERGEELSRRADNILGSRCW